VGEYRAKKNVAKCCAGHSREKDEREIRKFIVYLPLVVKQVEYR